MNEKDNVLVDITLLKPVNLYLEERIRDDGEYMHYGRKNVSIRQTASFKAEQS